MSGGANEFVFEGIDELLAKLRTLPAELAAAAAWYVQDAAAQAESDVRAVYDAHRDSGNLTDQLTHETTTGAFGSAVRVSNKAHHAWIFENGTQARHYTSKHGKPHATGQMWGQTAQPPTHVFVRAMQKHRKRMYERLTEMLEREGLEVTGEP